MLCVPFRTGTAHVVKLGPIGVAGAPKELVAAHRDFLEQI